MRFRVAITTLGCKTNHYDSAALLGRLNTAWFDVVSFTEIADAYVINSCTVTAASDRQSRQLCYQAKRRNPNASVILTGCYAAHDKPTLLENDRLDYVISKQDEESVCDLLYALAKVEQGQTRQAETLLPLFDRRTRPYVKIQDGCPSRCAYCIISRVRGPVISQPIESIIAELDHLADGGYKEVVLTGIHIGAWGMDLPSRPHLASLLTAIDQHGRIPRVRISSLEPMECTDEVIDIVSASSVFCHHLHIPLQSGSDAVLQRMRRPYTSRQYQERIQQAAGKMPDLGLGMDVIVGFPGESESDFQETKAFLESLPFSYLHVFPYSERPGTPAATFSDSVPVPERKRRARELIALSDKRRREKASERIGTTLSVLVEHKKNKETGFWQGFSRTYQACLIPDEGDYTDRIIDVVADRFHTSTSYKLMGRMVP